LTMPIMSISSSLAMVFPLLEVYRSVRAGGKADRVVHPVNALRKGVIGRRVVCGKGAVEPDHTVGGRAAMAAGNGDLRGKKAVRQKAGQSRDAVFAHGEGRQSRNRCVVRVNHQKHQWAGRAVGTVASWMPETNNRWQPHAPGCPTGSSDLGVARMRQARTGARATAEASATAGRKKATVL
jgi:hypothetical protein